MERRGGSVASEDEMRSHYIETYGVFLGFARRFMGGWLLCSAKGQINWSWCYPTDPNGTERDGIEEALKEILQ